MWVARDKDGTLNLFTHKPKRSSYIHDSYWEIPDNINGFANEMELPSSKFKNLKWKNEPLKVELKIVE